MYRNRLHPLLIATGITLAGLLPQQLSAAEVSVADTAVIYTAQQIITMNPAQPQAAVLAVGNGRVLALGSLRQVKRALKKQRTAYRIDHSFANKVILPGFIDPHLHPLMAAQLLPMEFITPFDWQLPGRSVTAVRGKEAYLARLRHLASTRTEGQWLFTWGHHSLFHGDVWRADLDAISTSVPIVVWGRSYHEVRMNTAALQALALLETPKDGPAHGVDLERGWFYETGLFLVAMPKLSVHVLAPQWLGGGLQMLKAAVHQGGITTIGDMAFGISGNTESEYSLFKRSFDHADTPFRLYLIPSSSLLKATELLGPQVQALAALTALKDPRENTRVQFLKHIKLFSDGAIYSQLSRFSDGYGDGHQGEWMMPPAQQRQLAELFWRDGWQLHVHTNGDEGVQATLDILRSLLAELPREDHRFTFHHFAYATETQIREIGALGALVSANPYYTYTLGEAYAAPESLGPERSHLLVRNQTTLNHGAVLSFHSDFTMAPSQPLLLAWTAVNRHTPSGQTIGATERITVYQALRAITINAAYTLGLEDEIGSLEPGKRADLTILEQNPLTAAPDHIRDIQIWGTVLDGRLYPIEHHAK